MYHADILILGGGFGGLTLAKQLKNFKGSCILVDRTNHHLFQPLLYQVATSELVGNDIGTPIREVLRNQSNTRVIMDTATKIDRKEKKVYFANEDPVSYSKLVCALGARHSYWSHPEWERFAPGLKTLDDAFKIHDRILSSFEKAEICKRQEDRQPYLNFVIVGGGPTGVELAGAIADMTYSTLLHDYRNFDIKKANIYLIQGGNNVLPSFHESLCQKSRKTLERLGVQVLTQHHVTNIEEDAVYIDDKKIPARNIFWAAGVAASPILKSLDVPLDKQGRVIINPDLSIPGDPNVFVIGDAAHLEDPKTKEPLPGVAPVALQQGKYLAKVFKNKTSKPFKYLDKGSMATIGRLYAICEVGKFRASGLIGWFMWAFIHILFLVTNKSRFFVALRWGMYFFFRSRGARLLARPLREIQQHYRHDARYKEKP